MLDLAASVWLYALVLTSSLFVGVLLVQGVARQVRAIARVVHRVAAPAPVPAPACSPAPAPVMPSQASPVRQLATSGASAA